MKYDRIRAARLTVNPYRYAATIALKRLRWDLNPESWRSRHRLKKLKDTHRGKRAVILCNGPSLLKSDLSLLDGVFTIGLNKINLLFEKSPFRPSCIVAVNNLVIEQNADFYNSTEIPLFLDEVGKDDVARRPSITFLHSCPQEKFARDISVSFYVGATVTFAALQLAFHLGFQRVALIGCDHRFEAPGPAHKVVESGDVDPNHFDPNYFAGGVKWQLPDLAMNENAYQLARETYEAFDREVVNATVGGDLEVFRRTALDEFLSE